jgi:hypothetical protein
LNEAELFARGELRDIEPLATDPSWPGPPASFVPTGHSPCSETPGAFVPICPAGYPALLAAARVLAGRRAVFWITPIFGALAVWLAFVLARRFAGAAAGVLAAALTVTSPIFLFQVVQPMNDIVAAALWLGAIAIATRGSGGAARRAAFSGLVAGAAVTVRPNLLPLAAVVGLCVASNPVGDGSEPLRSRVRTLVIFAATALPGIAAVMLIQNAMYGAPLKSGYGDLGLLFSLSHVVPNLVRYTRWTLETHTPLIGLGLLSPVLLRHHRREAAWLVLFAFATLACYLPYTVFDAWWYQRFLLPGILSVLVLGAAVVLRFLEKLPPAARASVFFMVCSVLPLWYLQTAVERDAFRLHQFEARFRDAGEYAARLPPESAFITALQSGSVRFYSGRSSATWGAIEPGRLDDAIEFFRRHGRKPYLLFEISEEAAFRERFGGDRLGALAWPPVVEIDRAVRIYDPADYDRYKRGEYVKSERIRTRR